MFQRPDMFLYAIYLIMLFSIFIGPMLIFLYIAWSNSSYYKNSHKNIKKPLQEVFLENEIDLVCKELKLSRDSLREKCSDLEISTILLTQSTKRLQESLDSLKETQLKYPY